MKAEINSPKLYLSRCNIILILKGKIWFPPLPFWNNCLNAVLLLKYSQILIKHNVLVFFFCSLSSFLLSMSTDQEKMMASLFSLDLIENVCLVPNYSTVVETCSSLNILHIFPASQGKIQEKKGVWILGIRFLHSTFYIRKDWNQIKRKFPAIGSRGARYVGLQMFIIVSAFCRSEIFFFFFFILG